MKGDGQTKVFNSEDVLIKVFSYLKGKELKEVRKVCKFWNSLATAACFGQHFRLNVLELGKDPDVHASLSSQLQCPQIFFQNLVYHRVGADRNTNSIIYNETPCLPFLENIGYSHLIRQAYVRGSKQIMLLGKASRYGLLPNLTYLKLLGTEEESEQLTILPPHTFPGVRTLDLQDEFHPIWQNVVRACPNLLNLYCKTIYELPDLNQLRELIIYLPYVRTKAYVDKLEALIGTQSKSLEKLTITEFPELPAILAAKPLLFLREFTLVLEYFTEGRDTMDYRNLFNGAPNIKRLNVAGLTEPSTTWENVYFQSKLQHLEKLRFQMYDSENWRPHWAKVWQSCLPTGKPELCVEVSMPFIHNGNWFIVENQMEDALNMNVSNLIVKLNRSSSFSTLVRVLFHAEVNVLEEEREPKGMLEFRNGVHHTTDILREKDIRLLPAVLEKLAFYWKRINFKYFKIPENTLETVKNYLKKVSIPVEIYF